MNHVNGTCKRCGLENETIEHMLFNCPESKTIWNLSPVNWKDIDGITDFSIWWNDKIKKVNNCSDSAMVLNLSIIIMCHIWKGRIFWYFSNEKSEPPDIVAKALFEYNAFTEIMLVNLPNSTLQESYEYSLTMLEDGICLFVDAWLHAERKKASIGLVAMDSKGTLLHAHGSPIQFVGKAMIAEAFAIRKAIERAIQNGWRKIHIFSNGKGIVDMLKKSVKAS
ncbi:uncharacterized protein [Nicotiana sylvestris]|uniref:uncharacterized protein n=1 Tax=Nicotiana sylvestris TaxID=4096 RepID=UPI00388C5FC5